MQCVCQVIFCGQKTHATSTQTEEVEEKQEPAPTEEVQPTPADPPLVSDAEWQARLDASNAELTERLKTQFEEEKQKSLTELTDRVGLSFMLKCLP